MKQESDFIEMIIPSKPEYVAVVRLTVAGVANRMGYTYDEIEDIKIAVSEACTNAVHHAYKDKDGHIKVNFAVFQDRLEVTVLDQGQSFDIESVGNKAGPVDRDMPVEELSEGGLGLFLIKSLMDKVEISEDSGVVVAMTKMLNRDEVGSDANRIPSS